MDSEKSIEKKGRRNRLRAARGRRTLEKEKPLIFGMIQRGGQVVIRMPANVQRAIIKPFVRAAIEPGPLMYMNTLETGVSLGWKTLRLVHR